MMFDLPTPDVLYRALLDRDDAFDGRAYVGVTTTGVFCRLTCPARKPKRENCSFYPTVAACIDAGFRPCKRCHPMATLAAGDPVMAALLEALDQRPAYRWSESDLVRMGHDPSTVRRSFKRQFGMTFLEMARQRRLRDGFGALADSGSVIDAQLSAGFESASAFRAAFARLLGCAPGHLKQGGLLRADWIPTPLGDMVAVASTSHLHLLEFLDRKALKTELAGLMRASKGDLGVGRSAVTEQLAGELDAYFTGKSARFDTPLAYAGSAFSHTVWDALRDIPAGQTRTYGQLAKVINRPDATRAVARANGANQIALVVPCHRVLGADGTLTGYGGGLWRKRQLIEIERQFATS